MRIFKRIKDGTNGPDYHAYMVEVGKKLVDEEGECFPSTKINLDKFQSFYS